MVCMREYVRACVRVCVRECARAHSVINICPVSVPTVTVL